MELRQPLHYLLYDQDCSLCVGFKEAVLRQDQLNQIEAVGFNDSRIPSIVPGMPEEQLKRSFHLVAPDGSVESAHQAMPKLLSLLPAWAWLGWGLKRLPGSQKLSERIYVWMAQQRK